ncbi:hypothetical protein EC991_004535 [Linnemannia zychae]|nr:hypothetical protein EC991_004535 [Linnemannia zychae]
MAEQGDIAGALEKTQNALHDVELMINSDSVWEDSSHLVFKKISQIAVGAVDYFMDKTPRSLLGLVLEWISTYTTLFTAPCRGCGKHLYFDSQQFKHLPPTLYTFDDEGMALPFHPACKKK